uniref:Zinc finger CCCH-type containing 11A n=1 Tax=Eptatretus burgeri TaxID=7764 RepID=A0A8C4R3S3_EPTBU
MAQQQNDCYFYFYSTCAKGDRCQFRHCEAALGSETVCKLWQEGCCFRRVCAFRHMEMDKRRSEIPCFWENQPSGCQKINCAFNHVKARIIDGVFLQPSRESVLMLDDTVGSVMMGAPKGPVPSQPATLPAANQVEVSVTPQNRTVIKLENTENVPSPTHPPVVINAADDDDEDDDDASSEETEAAKIMSELGTQKGRNFASASRKVTSTCASVSTGFEVKTLEHIRREKALRNQQGRFDGTSGRVQDDDIESDLMAVAAGVEAAVAKARQHRQGVSSRAQVNQSKMHWEKPLGMYPFPGMTRNLALQVLPTEPEINYHSINSSSELACTNNAHERKPSTFHVKTFSEVLRDKMRRRGMEELDEAQIGCSDHANIPATGSHHRSSRLLLSKTIAREDKVPFAKVNVKTLEQIRLEKTQLHTEKKGVDEDLEVTTKTEDRVSFHHLEKRPRLIRLSRTVLPDSVKHEVVKPSTASSSGEADAQTSTKDKPLEGKLQVKSFEEIIKEKRQRQKMQNEQSAQEPNVDSPPAQVQPQAKSEKPQVNVRPSVVRPALPAGLLGMLRKRKAPVIQPSAVAAVKPFPFDTSEQWSTELKIKQEAQTQEDERLRNTRQEDYQIDEMPQPSVCDEQTRIPPTEPLRSKIEMVAEETRPLEAVCNSLQADLMEPDSEAKCSYNGAENTPTSGPARAKKPVRRASTVSSRKKSKDDPGVGLQRGDSEGPVDELEEFIMEFSEDGVGAELQLQPNQDDDDMLLLEIDEMINS